MFAALAAAVMCVSAFAFDVTEYLPLKGTVKNYTRTDYGITSKFGEYFRTPEMKIVRVFDRAGREIESKVHLFFSKLGLVLFFPTNPFLFLI